MERWSSTHGRLRRFNAGDVFIAGNSQYRVMLGRKGESDLRLERLGRNGWTPVFMEETFLEADFFHENEQWLEQERPHWRRPGGSYFLAHVTEAARHGWQTPAGRIRKQREIAR